MNDDRFEKIANEIITPIMQAVYETAFNCLETEKGLVPIGVKDGVLESLDEVIERTEDIASFYDSASVVGFALGKDGNKPGRQHRSIAKIACALHGLIKSKDDQIKSELSAMQEHDKREYMAKVMGF